MGQYHNKTSEKISFKRNKFYRTNSKHSPKTMAFYKHKNKKVAIDMFNSGKINLMAELDPFQKTFKLIKKNIISDIVTYPHHRIGIVYLNENDLLFKNKRIRDKIVEVFHRNNFKKGVIPNVSWSNSFFPVGNPGHSERNYKKIEMKKINKKLEILLEKGLDQEFIKNYVKKKLSPYFTKISFKYLKKKDMAMSFMDNKFQMGITSIGLPVFDMEFAVYLYFIEKPNYLIDPSNRIKRLFSSLTITLNPFSKSKVLKEINNVIQNESVIIPFYNAGVSYVFSDGLKIERSSSKKGTFKINNILLRGN